MSRDITRFKNCNREKYNMFNFQEWDDMKLFGQGINVLILETLDSRDVEPYIVHANPIRGSSHAKQTALTCLEIAPEIELYTDFLYEKYGIEAIDEIIDKHNIDIVFASVTGRDSWIDMAERYKKKGVIFIKSGGNSGGLPPTKLTKSKSFINVGGITLDRGDIVYSDSIFARNPYIDFATWGSISLPLDRKDINFCTADTTGTSISCAVMAGLVARVQQLCKQRHGVTLNQGEMYFFLKDNVFHHGLSSEEVGLGALVELPHPKNIDFKKYKTNIKEQEEKGDEDVEKITFKDTKNHWAEKDILELVDDGILNGYEDGTFKPDNTLTRGEFAKALNNLRKLFK